MYKIFLKEFLTNDYGVHSLQETLEKFTEIKKIEETFTVSLGSIKEELDQHLDSINQNSTEIQSNYDFLDEINAKVNKLESRLDELTSLLKASLQKPILEVARSQMDLKTEEKNIFMALYMSDEPLTYEEISNRSNLPVYLVEDLITSMKIKQIPIVKKSFAGKVLVILDEDFRVMQTKHNILGVNKGLITKYN